MRDFRYAPTSSQVMLCFAAVLRSDCKAFYQFFDSLANPAASCGECARGAVQNLETWSHLDAESFKKYDVQGCNTEKLNYFSHSPCRTAAGVFLHNRTTS